MPNNITGTYTSGINNWTTTTGTCNPNSQYTTTGTWINPTITTWIDCSQIWCSGCQRWVTSRYCGCCGEWYHNCCHHHCCHYHHHHWHRPCYPNRQQSVPEFDWRPVEVEEDKG